MYVLDTDMSIFALRHHPAVKAHFEVRSPADIAVTTMTEAELYYGARNSRDPEASRRDVDAFLAPLTRLPFDSAAADHHARLRHALRAQPIGERDLVIASTVVAHAFTLVTRNKREFGRGRDWCWRTGRLRERMNEAITGTRLVLRESSR